MTVLHTSVKVNRPLAGHIIDDQGGVHGLCVVCQCIANGIVHIDLPCEVWAMDLGHLLSSRTFLPFGSPPLNEAQSTHVLHRHKHLYLLTPNCSNGYSQH